MPTVAVRRIVTTLALGLAVLGCSLLPVHLLTGGAMSCSPFPDDAAVGTLVADPWHGTVIKLEFVSISLAHTGGPAGTLEPGPRPTPRDVIPVMWPEGFTGRWVSGGQIEVRDEAGNVVATTGKRYRLSTGVPDKPADAYPACAVDPQ